MGSIANISFMQSGDCPCNAHWIKVWHLNSIRAGKGSQFKDPTFGPWGILLGCINRNQTPWKQGHSKKNNLATTLRVPTQTGKPGKMRRHFPVNFEETGKVRENHAKYWKIQRISENFVIFKSTVYYLLKWMTFSVKKYKTLKNSGKMEKYWRSQGILSVRKSGTTKLK